MVLSCMSLALRVIFWLYLFILVWADGTVFNWADPDLWHRLALGEYLWRTGHFPLGDTFSYLADYRIIPDHEWGSAVVFYSIYHAIGTESGFGTAMVGLKLVTLALTVTLLTWAGLRRQRPAVPLAAFEAIVLLGLIPSFNSTLRCMAFTHVLLALWIYWYQCERTGRRIPGWAYVVTMLLWANLHGGFVMGLLWLGLITATEIALRGAWKIWLGRLLACGLVTFVNPFGWRLWEVTLRALVAPRHGFPEWGPVTWFSLDYAGYKVLLLATAGAFIYLWGRRHERRIDYRSIVLISAFLVLSLTSARHTSLFALVAGGMLPGVLPTAPRPARVRTPLRRLAYMGLCSTCLIVPLFAALTILPGDGLHLAYSPDSCPRHAVDFLQREGIRGNLLTPFNYGSYAMWILRGQMCVSMDGRYDLVYKPATYDRVNDFYLGKPSGQSLLTSPKPAAILIPEASAVYPQLRANPLWQEAYHGHRNAVFLPR
jgi:hypothetical protein